MRQYLLVPLVAALGACAAPQPMVVADASTGNAQGTPLVCHQESVTGSGMIHTVCTRPPTEAERNALQEDLRRMPPNNLIAHPAAGSP